MGSRDVSGVRTLAEFSQMAPLGLPVVTHLAFTDAKRQMARGKFE